MVFHIDPTYVGFLGTGHSSGSLEESISEVIGMSVSILRSLHKAAYHVGKVRLVWPRLRASLVD